MSANQQGCSKCGHTIHCWRCNSQYCSCFVDTEEFHKLYKDLKDSQ